MPWTLKKYRAGLLTGACAAAIAGPAMAAEITFYYPVQVGGPLTEIMDGYVEAFEAEHPDISVEAIYAGNYLDTTTRALTAARAGSPPTVAVLLATDIFTLIDEDVVQPISDFIETDEDQEWVDGFMPAYLASAQIDGELWSVPFQRSTAVLYYNKEAFEAAGLDPDSPPTTWDEMVEYGKAVTEPGRWGVGIPGSSGAGQWLFGALVAQNGGTLASEDGTETYFTDPAVVEALQFWVDLNAVHGIHPPGVQEWGTTPSDFLEGRLVMAWTTTGNLTNIRNNATFNFGLAPYPGNPEPASVLGGGNLYIFSGVSEEQKQAAFEFVKFMTSSELLADWGIQTGYVAPRDESWETDAMQAYVEEVPEVEVAREQIAVSVPELSTYENARVSEALNTALQAALSGTQSPEAALEAAQAEAERILRPYRN